MWFSAFVEARDLVAVEHTQRVPAVVQEASDRFMDAVAPHHGVVSVGSASWGAQISIQAESVAGAAESAVRVAGVAARKAGMPDWPVVRVEVVREDAVCDTRHAV